ncbi:MAG TPA: hypothetical protein VM677_02660 [Actinokineospora sp.]|nr:hypothetical protein [Actinokineospora sp.]
MVCDLIEECRRHTGHVDLLRESVDGLVGEDPPAGRRPWTKAGRDMAQATRVSPHRGFESSRLKLCSPGRKRSNGSRGPVRPQTCSDRSTRLERRRRSD